MCGISGVTTNTLSLQEREVFNTLMLLSNLRGSLGAGVVLREDSGDVRRIRTLYNGLNLTSSQLYHDAMNAGGSNKISTVIGHTRAPTRGAHEMVNIHPHDSKHIMGVHNGTLYNVRDKTIPADASDSALLYEHIADEGIEKAVQDASGAFALVWIDKEAQTLNFLRNSQRTLWFAKVAGGSTMYWASEKIFLEFALARSKFHNPGFEECPTDTHLVFDLTKKGEVKPVSEKIIRKAYTFRGNGSHVRDGGAYGEMGDVSGAGALLPYGQYRSSAHGTSRSVSASDFLQNAEKRHQEAIDKLKAEPVTWYSLPEGKLSTSSHGLPVRCKRFDPLPGVLNSTFMIWWADGSRSVYNHFPYYIMTDHNLKQYKIEQPSDPEPENNVIPFGKPSEADSSDSSSAANEADLDCKLSVQHTMMQELDKFFPIKDDELPWGEEIDENMKLDDFEESLSRANNRRGIPKESKAERRRRRARERTIEFKAIREAAAEKDKLKVTADKHFKSADTQGKLFTSEDEAFIETAKNCWKSAASYERYLAAGCGGCGCVPGTRADTHWYSPTEFLCTECNGDEVIRAAANLEAHSIILN